MGPKRATRRQIPSFSLYGEGSTRAAPLDALHIEDIPSRSRKYLWTIGVHRHARLYQCILLTAGPARVNLEGHLAEYVGPALIVIPAGAVHGFEFQASSCGFVLTLDLGSLSSAVSAAQQAAVLQLFAAPQCLDLKTDSAFAARLTRLFETLLQEFQHTEPQSSPVTAWLACSLLWVVASYVGAARPSAPVERHDLARLWQFRQLIEVHYLRHWPIERYAQRLGLSTTSLNRLCLSVTGATAFDVVRERLALEARRRLQHNTGSVAALAAELGFKDPAYFSRFFRKLCGVSPTAFRRS